MKTYLYNRLVHKWGSILIAVPLLFVVCTGILLQVKKQVVWVQPPSKKGGSKDLNLSFDEILAAASKVPEAEISSWKDVDRLDVRPSKGMVKVRAENRWEVQVDTQTGEILQVAYRRSDVIESLHDGSFFGDGVKLGIFLPSAIILLVLLATGIYLFFLPGIAKRRQKLVASRDIEPGSGYVVTKREG